jgi:hypothetical protein
MAELPPELGPAQAPVTQDGQEPMLRDQLSPMVQDPNAGPADEFLAELLSIADELGFLDEAFGPPSIADRADELDANADPFEFLSKEQLTRLVQLFLAIPEPKRSEIGNALREQLPPQVAERLEAIVRFVGGRDAQQGITR